MYRFFLYVFIVSSQLIAQEVGIWTRDLSRDNLLELRKEGFNSLLIPLGPFWDEVKDKDFSNETLQILAGKILYQKYLDCKEIGFTSFLIDGAWGLGSYDNNYFYEKVIEQFSGEEDVYFYAGEIILYWMNEYNLTLMEIKDVLRERYSLTNKWRHDEVIRNYKLITQLVDSSSCTFSEYPSQQKHWHNKLPFVWISGQLKYHNIFGIGGTSDYEFLIEEAQKHNINNYYLYQGDPPDWSLGNIFLSILDLFGCNKSFERERRLDFIKAIKKQTLKN